MGIGVVLLLLAALGAFFLLWPKAQQSLDVDLSQSSASGSVTLSLVAGTTSIQPGQDGYVDIMINPGSTVMTAVELRLAISGPATIKSLGMNEHFNTVLAPAVITSTTASITVGSGTTGVSGAGRVARLAFTAQSQPGTVSVSLQNGTQAAGVGSTTTVLGSLPGATTITVTPVVVAAPTATLTTSRTSVRTGQLLPADATSAQLSWTTTGGVTATLNQANVGLNGTQSVSPTSTTTYTLIVVNAGGSTPKTVTINVIQATNTDGNDRVDIFDYNTLVSDFGKTGALLSDIDGNGVVNIFDYNIFVTNYTSQKTS